MMLKPGSIQLLVVLLIWKFQLSSCDPTNAAWTDHAQFIFYNGTISGSYVFNDGNFSCGDNGAYYFSGLNNSLMRVGVAPPWDSNPFWFELSHYGNDFQKSSTSTTKRRNPLVAMNPQKTNLKRGGAEASAQRRDYCFNRGGCTYDTIYNLEFATSWYSCLDEGQTCAQYIPKGDVWYHVSAEMVNLSTASVSTVSIGVSLANGDDSAYYSVKGDETTWVSNRTVDYNMFNFQTPKNYSSHCRSPEATFNWNDAKHMTYNVNFTNKTAVSQFSITSNTSTVTILFSGTRDDGDINTVDAWKNRPNNGISSDNSSLDTIQLADPRSYSLPHFTLTSGKGFNFSYSKEDGWILTSGSPTSGMRDSIVLTSIWLALVSLVVTLLLW